MLRPLIVYGVVIPGSLGLATCELDVTCLIALINVISITVVVRGTAFEYEPVQDLKVCGSDKE